MFPPFSPAGGMKIIPDIDAFLLANLHRLSRLVLLQVDGPGVSPAGGTGAWSPRTRPFAAIPRPERPQGTMPPGCNTERYTTKQVG